MSFDLNPRMGLQLFAHLPDPDPQVAIHAPATEPALKNQGAVKASGLNDVVTRRDVDPVRIPGCGQPLICAHWRFHGATGIRFYHGSKATHSKLQVYHGEIQQRAKEEPPIGIGKRDESPETTSPHDSIENPGEPEAFEFLEEHPKVGADCRLIDVVIVEQTADDLVLAAVFLQE
jgi:hypothetical protein